MNSKRLLITIILIAIIVFFFFAFTGNEEGRVSNYLEDLGIVDSMVYLLDPSDSFYKSIGGFTMPETIFVDVNGEIVTHKRGFIDLNEMRNLTNELLAGGEIETDPAPDFSLEDLDGNMVSLSDFRGQNLVINSWATWCPFCVTELPDFAALQKEFGDQIVVIAINRQESN